MLLLPSETTRRLATDAAGEGINLQRAHLMVNYDLPWNPMRIEQRIGRLHRLGQQHPVRIYNFVQAGTLQEHLLQILQEKLNLFELVVGETRPTQRLIAPLAAHQRDRQ